MYPGSPRDTQRSFSIASTDSATSGEQECLQTNGGDPPHTTGLPIDRPFEVGDVVKVEQKESPWYGVIRWIGQLPGSSESIAGIEMVYVHPYIYSQTRPPAISCNPDKKKL